MSFNAMCSSMLDKLWKACGWLVYLSSIPECIEGRTTLVWLLWSSHNLWCLQRAERRTCQSDEWSWNHKTKTLQHFWIIFSTKNLLFKIGIPTHLCHSLDKIFSTMACNSYVTGVSFNTFNICLLIYRIILYTYMYIQDTKGHGRTRSYKSQGQVYFKVYAD